EITGGIGFTVTCGDAYGQTGLPCGAGLVTVSQASVDESLHLCRHMHEIDGGCQDDPRSIQQLVYDRAVIVIDPAGALLHAESATGAVFDVVLTQTNDLKIKSALQERRSKHFKHHVRIAYPAMG